MKSSLRIPKLSCLLVTKDRLAQAKKAIHCFENQTLSDSELVIVDESEDGLAEYVQSLNNPRLRFIDPGNKELSLGELRNLSVQEARGDVVVQWDDDDWYHPDRLKRQWNAMQYTGAVACFLQRWTLAWPARDIFALSKRRYWEGSIMIQKEYIPEYTPKAYGEDSDMVRNLLSTNLTWRFWMRQNCMFTSSTETTPTRNPILFTIFSMKPPFP